MALGVTTATSFYTAYQLAALHEDKDGKRHNRYRCTSFLHNFGLGGFESMNQPRPTCVAFGCPQVTYTCRNWSNYFHRH